LPYKAEFSAAAFCRYVTAALGTAPAEYESRVIRFVETASGTVAASK